ncbi:MFS transporter [Acinetobacter guillouiae]|uniref:MFS transporter n=1 Tax=Acinetobacter guillouiae TaxID=106649 RepID=UPI00300AD500
MLDQASIQRLTSMSVAAFGAVISSTFPLSVIFAQSDIAGAFSVTMQDVGWVVTLYNVGQIIGLPIAFLFSGMLGRRRAMMVAGAGYILSSLLIVLINSFTSILALRVMQGAFAGMLPILMFIILFSTHPSGLIRTRGLTYFATATAIGVGVSAWLGSLFLYNENWRLLFIVPAMGIMVYVVMAHFLFQEDPIKKEVFKLFDWPGYLLISFALVSLVIFVSEGERHFWFQTWWITACLLNAILFLIFAFFYFIEQDQVLLRKSLFYKPFSYALVFQMVFRFGSLFVIWIIPQFLIQSAGFRIEQIAEVLWPFTAGTLIGLAVAYVLSPRIDQRIVMSFSLTILAFSSLYCSYSTSQWAIDDFLLPIFIAGLGQGLFSLATLHIVLYDILPVEGPTCGIGFNYARVLGLTGGIGILSHFIAEREKLHSAHLVEHVDLQGEETLSTLEIIEGFFSRFYVDQSRLDVLGYGQVSQHIRSQAFVLSYNDAFLLVFIILFIASATVWIFPHSKAIH